MSNPSCVKKRKIKQDEKNLYQCKKSSFKDFQKSVIQELEKI